MSRPDSGDTLVMGRIVFFILLVGAGDITRDVAPSLNEFKLILAQSVQIQDCQSLLR